MTIEKRLRRFAVLIDADNVSPRIAAGLFKEVAKLGVASVRRIYGDFSNQRLKPWAEILPEYAIDPCQQFPYTSSKNASDIALTIDAMDLLYDGRLDGFCLVSSDSDFTRLASRLREHGLDVYGFGQQKTPKSFRNACHRFICTEKLLPKAPTATPKQAPAATARQAPCAAIPLLDETIARIATEDGWVLLGTLGKHLKENPSGFDSRWYGCKNLIKLVRETGAFEVVQTEGHTTRIRAKSVQASDVATEPVTMEQPVL